MAVSYVVAVAVAIAFVFLIGYWLYRRGMRSNVWQRFVARGRIETRPSMIAFYEKMLSILAEKGVIRAASLTPVEFAHSLGNPEAMLITEKYNEARFGARDVSRQEVEDISGWLESLRTSEIRLCKDE